MTSSALPKKLQQARYNERVHEMVMLGQRAQSDARAAQTIAALAEGTPDERWLALKSCFGSRDQALILRLCDDPSLAVRIAALKLLARFGADAAITKFLPRLGAKSQRAMLRRLAKHGRFEPIKHFLLSLSEDRLIPLLPYGSEAFIKEHADQLFPRFSLLEWGTLARMHPQLACNWLQGQLRANKRQATRWLAAINTVLAIGGETASDAALELVKQAANSLVLNQLELQKLIYAKPREMADVALAHKAGEQPNFSPVITKLSYEQIEGLEERRAFSAPQYWLKQLPGQWRAKLYQKRQLAWRDSEGRLPIELIKSLPSTERIAEARRNLKLPELRGDQFARIAYAALLPWQEAEQELHSSFGHNEPSYRAAALAALIASAQYERRQSEVLALLERRRNEQDPVRLAMLNSVNELAASHWRSEQLAGLDKVIRAALDAGDLSGQSLWQLQELLVRLLPFHTEWSIGWMRQIWQERQFGIGFNAKERLNQAQFEQLTQAFLPLATHYATAGDYQRVIHMARQFQERLTENDPLIDLLESLLSKKDNQIVQASLALLAKVAPKRLLKLLPKLVRKDASFISVPAIYQLLHVHDQATLAQALALRSPQGRFNESGLLLYLPISRGFIRWTSAQQQSLANYLERIINADQVSESLVVLALEQLSELPSIQPNLLIQLASLAEERPFVRERALRALGRLDDLRAGIAPLLDALGDARARFAIYALRSALLQLRTEEALAILQQVPTERVTVAKEVLRLVGELHTPEAFNYLSEINTQELHRDVHIALLRALWDFLDYEQTWPILESAARSDDGVLAKSLTAIPNAHASAATQSRLLELTLLLLQHPDPQVRIAAISSLQQRQITSKQEELAQALLQASRSELPNERRAAIFYIFSLPGMSEMNLTNEVVKHFLEQRAYRWLSYITDHIQPLISWGRKNDSKKIPELITLLKTDPYSVTLAMRIATALQDWDIVYDLLEELRSRDLLHNDLVQSFERGVQYLVIFNRAYHQFEARLANHNDARFRRLALPLLQQEARQAGWKKSLLKRLEAYRADPNPQVAGPAHFIFPPESDDNQEETDWDNEE